MIRYDEIRSKIKTGDMLLWSPENRQGHFVRPTALLRYDRVGVAWVEHGRVFVLSGDGDGPRLLSGDLPCFWLPAPRRASDRALKYAFSRMAAPRGSALRRLFSGKDDGADFALRFWRIDGIAPADEATPQACAVGAMKQWWTSVAHRLGEG